MSNTAPSETRKLGPGFWVAFAFGMAPSVLNVIAVAKLRGATAFQGTLLLLSFAAAVLWVPLVAVLLALAPSCSRFGKAVLLGGLVGWLCMLTYCGGSMLWH